MKTLKDNLIESQELNEQIKELKRKKNRLQNETKRRVSWEQRKLRTKRLIETGALAEKYFGLEEFTLEQREKIFQTFSEFVKGKIKKY
ncbi:hypothetical protein A4Q63_14430 [Listeria monocytogenes]|uniref:hypothetical protein n=1 Tax=Listeria innocua TaxID=1642 RepID=UPI000869A1F2|nr:hypothetical protein [Listeria innocua]EAD3614959.1 hypothetical protein [Listeria monocytogenes]EAD3642354.1 hypothetical protein [Listeria monocytogenes]EAD5499297.1 hypothetical protein [Listeria monocytogenes]EAE1024287.1 hypothetical protein [Listeria monocytogenes]EAE1039433.1 hypothetical protein [Listeria monocytogenes]